MDLEGLIAKVVTCTVRVFKHAGLILNFQQKKTEAVVAFRSQQAPDCRYSLFVERMGGLCIPEIQVVLKCVAEYEHLGTTFTADGLLRAECAHRRVRATQAFRQVAKPILRNRHVSVDTRLKLFESLVVPVLLHGAGNWGLLPTRQFASLQTCLMNWQRSIINDGFWTDNQHTDFDLQCKWKLPPLAFRLAKARLLYAFHLFRDGPHLLVDYVTDQHQAPHGWFSALRHALQWLASLDDSFCPHDLHVSSHVCIVEWFAAHDVDGPRRVRRLFRKSLLQMHVLGDAVALHHQLHHSFVRHGVSFQDGLGEESSILGCHFACDWCAHEFDSQQKLQAHQWVAHQIISAERQFVFSDTCLSCHKCFWSAARLQQHLRLSRNRPNGCYETITWRYAPLRQSCAADVPEDLRGFKRLPAVQVACPSSLPIEQMIPDKDAALRHFRAAWDRESLPDQLDEDLQEEIFHAADLIVSAWRPSGHTDVDSVLYALGQLTSDEDARMWALHLWCHQRLKFRAFSHLDPATFGRLKQAVQDLLDCTPIGRLLAWQNRMAAAYRPDDLREHAGSTCSRRGLEVWFDPPLLHKSCFDKFRRVAYNFPDCQRVPVSFENGQPTIWLLHLFSGRRRRGDCHFWTTCFANMIPGYQLKILSVDTAIDPVLGNLDRGPVFTQLLQIVRKRFFTSGLTGPPCETFSAARHVVIPGSRHPRPLRSSSSPWILAQRSFREL